MWARGYFCGSVGQVDDEMIQKYIETQGKEEGNENIEVVDG